MRRPAMAASYELLPEAMEHALQEEHRVRHLQQAEDLLHDMFIKRVRLLMRVAEIEVRAVCEDNAAYVSRRP